MSVNKVILIGNVGRDPEVRYLENGVAVAQFTLATSERGYTNNAGVQVPEKTEWHNIVLWRGLAETAEKFVRKGTQLYIEGKITTRSYDAQDGSKRYVTEIVASNMTFVGSRRDNEGQNAGTMPAASAASQPAANPYAQPMQQAATSNTAFAADKSSTDDLPF